MFNYDIDYNKRKILLRELNGNIITFDVDDILSLFFELLERIRNFEQILFALFLKLDRSSELFRAALQLDMNQEDIEDSIKRIKDLDEEEVKSFLKDKFNKFFSNL